MSTRNWLRAAPLFIGVLAPVPALAQRTAENAVAAADDAFGTQVGLEASGIYTENDTRGLSPLKAGNARLDGIYFDPVASISGRLRSMYSIRTGVAAIDYAFAAPTGVVDSRLRTAGDKLVASASLTKLQYSGHLEEFDAQIPIVAGKLSLAAGVAHATTVTGDGAVVPSDSFLLKPVLRFGGAEISPFYNGTWVHDVHGRPLIVTSDALVPPQPELGHYLGQDWAKGKSWQANFGVTAKVPLTSNIAFRGGLFRSEVTRHHNFTELFRFAAPGTTATHRLIADPRQHLHSVSGEGQIAVRFGTERLIHRVIAGYRMRHRYTESGGSDVRDLGTIDLYGTDPEPEPVFAFRAVNLGKVDQSAMTLGYQLDAKGIGRLNLGLQRVRYRALFRDAQTGTVTRSRDDAWVYNASGTVNLVDGVEIFAGVQTGLEDSGAAPENATNRNEQLPTTRSTQYEAGLRWKFGQNRLVASAFQIKRPYFSFDGANRFTELGEARYRGVELSFAGHFGRLTALAGAVFSMPEVTGPGRDAGLVGKRPAGMPDVYSRIDLQYRTDLLGGLTPTVTVIHTGSRAMGSAPVAALGGQQAMLGAYTSLDLGLRQQFRLGTIPASLRMTAQNVLNEKGWKVLASNTLQMEEHRRLMVTLSADF